jgi:DNA-binding NarL/FixJ family response regulator
VIILTSFGEDDQVIPAIRAGAQGYLLKDIPPHDLVQAVREAHQGKAQLHPDVAKKLMSAVAAPPAAPPSPEPDLTERELEVLRLIAQDEQPSNRAADDQREDGEDARQQHSGQAAC